MALVKQQEIDGHKVEVHAASHGLRRYWVQVDGQALVQEGRMRPRTFSTAVSAWRVAVEWVRELKKEP